MGTPNYLCDADAIPRIYQAAPEPGRLRFIVVMRDPIMRAFSEWSMFALGWGWEFNKDFPNAMAAIWSVCARAIRRCSRTRSFYGRCRPQSSLSTCGRALVAERP